MIKEYNHRKSSIIVLNILDTHNYSKFQDVKVTTLVYSQLQLFPYLWSATNMESQSN